MGAQIRTTCGPAIERAGDLAAVLTSLGAGDVLFIDEIHRLSHVVEEILYPAMEDFALDVVLGKGPGARTVRLQIEHVTVIGATTRVGSITGPLRDRFGVTYRLDYYTAAELERILRRSAEILDVDLTDDAARLVAARSRGTPRIANRLLKRVRDYAQVRGGEDDTVTGRSPPMRWPCSRSTTAGSTPWIVSFCGRSPSTTAGGRSGWPRWPRRSRSRSRRSRTSSSRTSCRSACWRGPRAAAAHPRRLGAPRPDATRGSGRIGPGAARPVRRLAP